MDAEGSTRREGSRVRVSATLVQVKDQTQRWADTFDRELASILTLQNEVARGVAQGLAITLLPADERRLAAVMPSVHPQAYEAVLKGMQHLYRLTPEQLDVAQQYFEVALRHDPNHAAAYNGLAGVWAGRQQMGYVPPSEAIPKVIDAAQRAIERDPSAPDAHMAVATARFVEWNWADCERALLNVIERNPNYSNARALYSHVLNMLQRPLEARAQIERALAVDPYNGFLHGFNGVDLLFERRWDDAIGELRAALKISPDLPFAARALVTAFQMKRSTIDALDALRSYARIMGYSEVEQIVVRHRGTTDEYPQIMRQAADALVVRSSKSPVIYMDIVAYFTYAGEQDSAIEWLEKAVDTRDPSAPYVSLPDYDPLRHDLRYRAVMRRLNLPS